MPIRTEQKLEQLTIHLDAKFEIQKQSTVSEITKEIRNNKINVQLYV